MANGLSYETIPFLITAGVAGFFTHYVLSNFFSRKSAPAIPSKSDIISTNLNSDSEDDSDDDEPSEPYKMILVVRTDLKMTKGKIASQVGHGVLGLYKKALKKNPQAVKNWEKGGGQAKIATQVPTEEDLLRVEKAAKDAGIVTYLVLDAGRTQIASGSMTVLALGPDTVSRMDSVTKKLKLL
eukprot:TRINITY_DN6695_c0_g1_i2.p1 TRINITY_DN6695_c0_g1~~TRINITY_DN6695_c0_g1_i2.p1  ORF type:complete len:208 (-),score=19.89 TRINITY_DN6695_c0_g1_i2:61-609(-)